MKLQCDCCTKQEAIVFCLADESALCSVCDQRVHQANKIASRHKRFSLLDSSSDHMPLCDICQKRRGLFFCHQDRAILCRDCDPLKHQANEHTQNHNRFLLVGINMKPNVSSQSVRKTESECYSMNNGMKNPPVDCYGSSSSASTISEYLTCVLPGWEVEDLLDSIASPPRLNEDKQPAQAVDLRRKMSKEKMMDEKSSKFQRLDVCAGFKRKRGRLL